MNFAQKKLTFHILYEVSGSIRSDADEDNPIFLVIRLPFPCLQPKYELLHQLINATILQMSQLVSPKIYSRMTLKRFFFLSIGEVRFSHLPTDSVGSEFEMCCFEMS